jgi:hypothetical protein
MSDKAAVARAERVRAFYLIFTFIADIFMSLKAVLQASWIQYCWDSAGSFVLPRTNISLERLRAHAYCGADSLTFSV